MARFSRFNYRNTVVMEQKLSSMFLSKLAFSNYSMLVSRITTKKPLKIKAKATAYKDRPADDGYSVCIKAKAMVASSGPTAAISFGLKRLRAQNAKSRAVLLNTLLCGCLKAKDFDSFWKLYESRIQNDSSHWSPELGATLLSCIGTQMEQESDPSHKSELFSKGIYLYAQALEALSSKPAPTLHLHNSFLKVLSRQPNVPFLLWLLPALSPAVFSKAWADSLLTQCGLVAFAPNSADLLKMDELLQKCQNLQPTSFDTISLTSMLNTIARCPQGSLKIAESMWREIKLDSALDKSCYVALLLVYRNDAARMLGAQKLVRSESWRLRCLDRVCEYLACADPNWHADVKLVSIYYETCLNLRLCEKVVDHAGKHNVERCFDDERLRKCIKKARTIHANLKPRQKC